MNNLRRLTAVLAASTLVLVGCSNGEQSEPAPVETATETATETTTSEEVDPGITIEGAPEGFELTPPGTQLSYGEPAHVVVQDGESLAFLEVIAHEPRVLSIEEAQVNSDNSLAIDENTEEFLCFDSTVRLLGVNGEAVAFEGQRWTPVDRRGRVANRVEQGDEIICGIHESEVLPANTADMVDGREYVDARASFSISGSGGLTPTHLAFNYQVEGVDGIAEGDSVFWG